MGTSADSSPRCFITTVWHLKELAHVKGEVFKMCKDDFGIPKGHQSAPVKDQYGITISNTQFLPPPGARLEDYQWDITGNSGPPLAPEHRELWVHLTSMDRIIHPAALTPLELCISIGHSMLGWLSMLHRGILHRDIGLPTVTRLTNPVVMTPFAPGNFEQVLETTQAGNDDKILEDQVERLRKAIADLEITGACCGVVQPSDMAVKMKDYYGSGGSAYKPDYYQFMSSGLLRSIRLSEPYLHSPVDDLESFYYTLQREAVDYEGSDASKPKTDDLEALRVGLSGSADDRFQATLFVHRIRPSDREDVQKFGAFLARLQPVLKEWYPSILGLVKSWRTVRNGVDETNTSGYYIRHALVFAYRGVADYLKIVHAHRESLA